MSSHAWVEIDHPRQSGKFVEKLGSEPSVDLHQSSVDDAKDAYFAYEQARKALTTMAKPTVTFTVVPETDEENEKVILTCPGCGGTDEYECGETDGDSSLVVLDQANTQTSPHLLDPDTKVAHMDHSSNEPHWREVTLLMACCNTPVSLPEGWSQV